MNIFDHGDVGLREVEKVEGEVVQNDGSFILAYGEVTGHKHVITAEQMEIRKTTDGQFYLSLGSEGKLSHEEHKTLTIPVGDYAVTFEREHDWFTHATRRVQD